MCTYNVDEIDGRKKIEDEQRRIKEQLIGNTDEAEFSLKSL
jgi:hypothetical protein